MRTLVRKVHLWFGLSVGTLFALLGLTGSVLVFYQGIDALLHPEIAVEASGDAPGWQSPLWDRGLATVRRQWPERTGAWRFEVTGEPGVIPARYMPRQGVTHSQRIMVWLTPDAGRVIREQPWGGYAMTWIYNLHMELLLGEPGMAVIGWAGLGMFILLVAGLWSWWPRGSWRKALRYKRGSQVVRKLRDWHKLAGLASLPLLFVLVVTGVMLALPDESNAVLTAMISPVETMPKAQSSASSGTPISILQALSIAQGRMPEGRLAWVEAPGPGNGAFMVRIQQPGDPSYRFPHSFILIDQYSGNVLAVQDSQKATVATTVNNWLHSLHDGSVGGITLRIILVVIGVAPFALWLTGLIRWALRRRAAHARTA